MYEFSQWHISKVEESLSNGMKGYKQIYMERHSCLMLLVFFLSCRLGFFLGQNDMLSWSVCHVNMLKMYDVLSVCNAVLLKSYHVMS